MATEEKENFFYKAQDGYRGRDGGPYMDTWDQQEAEKRRAVAEGREPDLDNPPPVVGTQLVTSAFLQDNVFSNPSMVNAPGLPDAMLAHKDDDEFLTSPVTSVPVDDSEFDKDEEDAKAERLADFNREQRSSSTNKKAAAKRTAAKENTNK